MRERLFKVVTISFLVLFVVNAMAEAEQGEHHRMHPGHGGMMHDGPDINRIVEHMSRKLELDDTQQLAIRNIVDAVKPEAEALREQARSNREAIHTLDISAANYHAKLQDYARRNGELVTQITLLHGRVMAEVNAELTDEQRAKLAEARVGMRERFRHHLRSSDTADDTTT